MAAIALISLVLFAGSLTPFAGTSRPSADTSASEQASDRAGEIADLQKKYDEARDPVHRAKALAQLGEAQVKDAAARVAAHDYAGTIAELRKYGEEVVSVRKDLVASGVNAERKPGGFRELQLSVRENLQRIEDIAFAASVSQQAPLVEIHEQLGQENQMLLKALFPPVSGESAAPRPGHP